MFVAAAVVISLTISLCPVADQAPNLAGVIHRYPRWAPAEGLTSGMGGACMVGVDTAVRDRGGGAEGVGVEGGWKAC